MNNKYKIGIGMEGYETSLIEDLQIMPNLNTMAYKSRITKISNLPKWKIITKRYGIYYIMYHEDNGELGILRCLDSKRKPLCDICFEDGGNVELLSQENENGN